jgi:hypothetical protein
MYVKNDKIISLGSERSRIHDDHGHQSFSAGPFSGNEWRAAIKSSQPDKLYDGGMVEGVIENEFTSSRDDDVHLWTARSHCREKKEDIIC